MSDVSLRSLGPSEGERSQQLAVTMAQRVSLFPEDSTHLSDTDSAARWQLQRLELISVLILLI